MEKKHRTRVIVTASTFPRTEDDSTPRFVLDFCRALARGGVDCVAVVPHGPGLPRRERMEGIEVRRFPYAFPSRLERLSSGSCLANLTRAPWKLALIPGFCIGQWIEIERARRELDPVYLIAHWLVPQGAIAALIPLGSCRLVLFCHGGDAALIGRLPGARRIGRWLNQRAYRVLAGSRKLATKLDRAIGIEQAVPLPLGFDPKIFHPSKSQFVSPELLFVGRLVPQKGIEDLLAAMPRILENFPEARLSIVGDGPLKRKLLARAGQLGLGSSVVFHGGLPQREVAKRMRRAKVLVFPSRSAEGFGLVALEAMASGLPVVAARTAELELIEHGKSGLIAEYRDDLWRAVCQLLTDDLLHASLRRNGLARARPYRLEAVSRELLKQLELTPPLSKGYTDESTRV